MENHTNTTLQRKRRKIPSLKKHGLSAVLLLAIILITSYFWLEWAKKQPQTGPIIGETSISKPPQKQIRSAGKLPDLLAGDNIPIDKNPTEKIALIGAAKASNEIENSGPRPPTIFGTNSALSSEPKTIYINGKPIGQTGDSQFSAPLIQAPIQGLSRTSLFGKVPTPSRDGRTVLQSYAKPFTPRAGTRYISLVIGGLGLNGTLTKQAITELPGSVSLSFAANAPDLQMWIDLARKHGHEVLLEIPMEGLNDDPATSNKNHTLTRGNSAGTNIRNLDYLLSRAEGYFAVTNYDGDSFATSEQSLFPALGHIKNAGLGFLYDGALSTAPIESVGRAQNLKITTANQFIDAQIHDAKSVQQILNTLTAANGASILIGMGFSYEGTIEGVLAFLRDKPKHLDIAPVSYVLKSRTP
ncbi:MAG: divergent polysaccharide deacetylase family protein [Robiginitomaculum sp.]